MKRIVLFGFVTFVISPCFAQVKVANNGNTLFGYPTSNTPLSTISVNCNGKKDTKVAIQGTEVGLYTKREGTAHWGYAIQGVSDNLNTTFSVGVKAEAFYNAPLGSGRCYGVFGSAGNATSGWNYGVFGRLQGEQNGAGVYGTITGNENGTNTKGRYAGYFNGPTKVVGNLSVTGSINGVLLGKAAEANYDVKTNKYSHAANYETNSDFASKLENLSLISYYMPHCEEALAKNAPTSEDTIASNPNLTKTEIQCLEKKHYALSADQVQEEFPNLVYEQEDGSKAINYVEIIPILIQTIKELNNKITKLESCSLQTESCLTNTDNVAQENIVLYKNTPNPFNNFTTIKAYLPHSVKKASVYFYDTNGINVKSHEIKDRGHVSVKVHASDFLPSLYVYALIIDGRVFATDRMIVDK